MSSLEIVDTTMKGLQSEGCQIPAEFQRDEDGGVCQNPVESRETEGGGSEDVEDGYRTPTGPEYRIPEPLECPAAPIKPSRRCSGMKRKREFYDVDEVDSEEIQLFLRQLVARLLTDGCRKIRKLVVLVVLILLVVRARSYGFLERLSEKYLHVEGLYFDTWCVCLVRESNPGLLVKQSGTPFTFLFRSLADLFMGQARQPPHLNAKASKKTVKQSKFLDKYIDYLI